MINIKEADDSVKNKFSFETQKVYELSNENELLGYGTINKNNDNLLSVYIKEEHRGNGYGKTMFNNLLENAKVMGYNDARLTVSKHNIPMIRIIEGANGFRTSIDNEYANYVVPTK